MTQPNRGRASIEIVGDVSKLGRQLQRDAQRAVDNVDLDTEHLADEVSGGFTKGMQQIQNDMKLTEFIVEGGFLNIQKAAEEAAEEIVIDFEEGGARIRRVFKDGREEAFTFFDGVGDKSRETGETIQSSLLAPLTRGFSRLGDLLGSAASAAAGLAISGTNPAGLLSIVATLIAVGAAIPVVLGLAGALSQLAGVLTVLPGLIGAFAGAMIVGVIAFQGFGDALGAIADGDPEKIAEALKELAPAARQVAREFQAALPLFRQVGDSIQQEFFEPLVGQLATFSKTTLPALRGELDTLAQALGRAFGHFGDLVNDAENVSILEELLRTTAFVTDELGASFSNLGDALFKALGASLPMLARLGSELSDAIDTFAEWLRTAAEDGSFQRFWEQALDVLGRVWNLAKAIGGLLGTLLGGTAEGGKDFIDTLTDLTNRLNEFFKSAEGQEALQDFEEIIGAVGVILGYVVNVVRETIDILTELDDAVEAVIGFFTDLWDTIVAVWDGIVAGTESGVNSVGDFFADLWQKATTIWEAIVDGVSSAVDSVITFFTELPGKIWEAIQALPGLVAAALNAMIDQAISILAVGIAAVIVFFTELPGQIVGAWNALTTFLGQVWDSIVTTVSEGVDAAVAFVQSIPERLAEIGIAIVDWAVGLWDTVSQTTIDAWNAILEFFSTLPGKVGAWFQGVFNAVVAKGTELVNWIRGIPGRILSALGNVGSMLYDAGAKIVQGLINGIASKFQQLKDKIAAAAQEIRNHLPFSPAKTGPLSGDGSPDLAGAKIAAMIAAGLDSGLPLITGAAGRSAGAVVDAGLSPLTTQLPGAPAPAMSPVQATVEQQPIFYVQIGNEEVRAVVTKVVQEQVQIEVRRLVAGTRGV